MSSDTISSSPASINLTGFMYSGKTAVWEALVRTNFYEVPPGKETRIGRYPSALMSLFRMACSQQALDDESRLLSTAFFLGALQQHNLSSKWISAHQPKEWEWCNIEILKARTKYGIEYDKVFMEILDFVQGAAGQTTEDILAFFQNSFAKLVDIISKTSDGKKVLFNNLYHSFDYESARMYEPISLIIVDRDIRDIFAETVAGEKISVTPENYKNIVNTFVARQQKGRTAINVEISDDFFEQGYLQYPRERALSYISFESFVLKSSTRQLVYENLGIPESSWAAADSQYNYDLSQKNIGKHLATSLPDSTVQYLLETLREKKIPFTLMTD